jgi:hypothetical protein
VLKYSAKRIGLPGILPGMVVGIAIGFLIANPSISRGGRPFTEPGSSADSARLSLAEIAGLPKSTLSCLCDEPGFGARSAPPTGEQTGEYCAQRTLSGESEIRAGIANARRLLPLAKRLSIKTLLELGEQNGLPARDLSLAQRKIMKVDRIVLDGELGDSAAVQDERPREIRIGSGYAETLISDDEAVFLLAHELTHVAAQTGKMGGFIENVSRRAKVAADVEVLDGQEEDLACDFIATHALKHFIDLHPTKQSKAERLLYTCGYEPPSERLARAWEDFCASYHGFPGDGHHLSQGLTVRALAGLDNELKALIDSSSAATVNNPER